jgi:hypothetical protein
MVGVVRGLGSVVGVEPLGEMDIGVAVIINVAECDTETGPIPIVGERRPPG